MRAVRLHPAEHKILVETIPIPMYVLHGLLCFAHGTNSAPRIVDPDDAIVKIKVHPFDFSQPCLAQIQLFLA